MDRISNKRCLIFQEVLWWLVKLRDVGDTEESWSLSGNTEKGRMVLEWLCSGVMGHERILVT